MRVAEIAHAGVQRFAAFWNAAYPRLEAEGAELLAPLPTELEAGPEEDWGVEMRGAAYVHTDADEQARLAPKWLSPQSY